MSGDTVVFNKLTVRDIAAMAKELGVSYYPESAEDILHQFNIQIIPTGTYNSWINRQHTLEYARRK